MPRFSSKAIAEHPEVPVADDGRWEQLVESWTERGASPAPGGPDRSPADYVVSIVTARDPHICQAQLAEILSLVRSQGGRVAGHETRRLSRPDPRTLFGKGTAQEIAARARACGATMLVLDAELTLSQTRNLEDAAGIAVCDREAVILNVFLRHARTRRARIQVEIAQLQYLRPRIRGVGLDMDQQAGGMARGRGPGETASELLARKLDGRLDELKKALRRVETSGVTQRRQRRECKRMVLVGYTNAGTTSLMNALTGAELSAGDAPFETLDTTSRCLTRYGDDVLLGDTVGFIRRLPERLIASFESTLTELAGATLLVVVVDAADPERAAHLRITLEMLARVGAQTVPRFYVFNKIDRCAPTPEDGELARLTEGHPWRAVSSHDAGAVASLAEALLGAVRRDDETLETLVPYPATALLSLVYARCRVASSTATPEGLRMRIEGPPPVIARIRDSLKELDR